MAENGSCGVSMSQVSWQWNPIVPAITSLTPASGTASGGTTVHINGTGFTTGETVNFTEQPQELAASDAYNPPVPATICQRDAELPASTCIQVTLPAVTVGNAYFVTVTTPGGTSQTALQRLHELRADLHLQPRGADGHRAGGEHQGFDHR